MKITYAELIQRYPDLLQTDPHEAVVMLAYLAGRMDRLDEEVQEIHDKAARKEIEGIRQCSMNS